MTAHSGHRVLVGFLAAAAVAGSGVSPAEGAVLNYARSYAMRIDGMPHDSVGESLAAAGDVNGDGVPDVLVGAPDWRATGAGPGAAYVVFGRRAAAGGVRVDLAHLGAADGYRIVGVAAGDQTGSSVAAVGDVNGDGVPDALIGAPGANANGRDSGAAYVVFGQRTPPSSSLSLANLDVAHGYRIEGSRSGERTGTSVAAADDVNGDGIADFLVGAGGFDKEATFVVYGQRAVASPVGLGGLPASQGYAIRGGGQVVAPAGDVNGDEVPDALISDNTVHANVILGQRSPSPAPIDLLHLKATQGYNIWGASIGGDFWSETEVHPAGDINGDGVPDLLTVAGQDVSDFDAGAYVIYGQRSPHPNTIDLTSGLQWKGPSPAQGYGMVNPPGGMSEDNAPSHSNMAAVGDVNGDQVPDVLVAGNSSLSLVYGQRSPGAGIVNLSRLSPSSGYRYDGYPDSSLAPAGDLTGDGTPDALVGVGWGRRAEGRVYVVALRSTSPTWPTVTLHLTPRTASTRCTRSSVLLTITTNAPAGTTIETRISLDHRVLKTTQQRTLKTGISTRTLRAGAHRVAAVTTAADGTRASATARFKRCP